MTQLCSVFVSRADCALNESCSSLLGIKRRGGGGEERANGREEEGEREKGRDRREGRRRQRGSAKEMEAKWEGRIKGWIGKVRVLRIFLSPTRPFRPPPPPPPLLLPLNQVQCGEGVKIC